MDRVCYANKLREAKRKEISRFVATSNPTTTSYNLLLADSVATSNPTTTSYNLPLADSAIRRLHRSNADGKYKVKGNQPPFAKFA